MPLTDSMDKATVELSDGGRKRGDLRCNTSLDRKPGNPGNGGCDEGEYDAMIRKDDIKRVIRKKQSLNKILSDNNTESDTERRMYRHQKEEDANGNLPGTFRERFRMAQKENAALIFIAYPTLKLPARSVSVNRIYPLLAM